MFYGTQQVSCPAVGINGSQNIPIRYSLFHFLREEDIFVETSQPEPINNINYRMQVDLSTNYIFIYKLIPFQSSTAYPNPFQLPLNANPLAIVQIKDLGISVVVLLPFSYLD